MTAEQITGEEELSKAEDLMSPREKVSSFYREMVSGFKPLSEKEFMDEYNRLATEAKGLVENIPKEGLNEESRGKLDQIIREQTDLSERRNLTKLMELPLNQKYSFSFSGSNRPQYGLRNPSIPFEEGSYSTVNHGTLQYFNTGNSGWLPDGTYFEVVFEEYSKGSPYDPAEAKGYYHRINPKQNPYSEAFQPQK